jgi:uncharacterized protein
LDIYWILFNGGKMMNFFELLAVLGCIYGCASVFGGLTGFGFSALGSLSLIYLPKTDGIALLMLLSILIQSASLLVLNQSHHTSGKANETHVLLPLLMGGVLGLPLGLTLLEKLDAKNLMAVLGVLLLVYSLWSIWHASVHPSNSRVDSADSTKQPFLKMFGLGVLSGILGGFAAFPSAAIVVWNSLRGASKEQSRALTGPCILFMQLVGFLLLCMSSQTVFGPDFWQICLIVAPLALLGNQLGLRIYNKTGDRGYRQITLMALGLIGMSLSVKAIN